MFKKFILIIAAFFAINAYAGCECHPAQVGMTDAEMTVYAPLIAKAAKNHGIMEASVWKHLEQLRKIDRKGAIGPFKLVPAWHQEYLMGADPKVPSVQVDVGVEIYLDKWAKQPTT